MLRPVAIHAVLLLTSVTAVAATTDATCAVTLGTDQTFDAPFPDAGSWYGSESLAVVLSNDGTWSTTSPTARIAVKLFVWSLGFEPGMEHELSVTIDSLSGLPNDAIVKDVTNAGVGTDGSSAMLAGIDFPSAGCWNIHLDYRGQSLSFVVETVARHALDTDESNRDLDNE